MGNILVQRSGGGASKTLANLANVAVNTDLLPDGDGTRDLGATGAAWADAWIGQIRGSSILRTHDTDTGGTDNTFLGENVAPNNAAANNVIIGENAGNAVTAAETCVIVGSDAGQSLSGADGVVAVGYRALANQIDDELGRKNTALGFRAAERLTVGYDNTYIGDSAGKGDPGTLQAESLNETDFATHAKWDTTGDFDDTGGNAVYLHSTGAGTLTQTSVNMAIAGVSLAEYQFSYTISNVTATGTLAATITTAFAKNAQPLDLSAGAHSLTFLSAVSPGDFVISASSDTAGDGFTLDDVSLKESQGSNVSAENTGVGRQVFLNISNGYENTVVGYYGMLNLTEGYYNAGLGNNALFNLTTGSQNVVVGHKAGYLLSAGDGNLFLGYNAGYYETGSNKLYIENSNSSTPLIYGEFDTDLVQINGQLVVAGGDVQIDNGKYYRGKNAAGTSVTMVQITGGDNLTIGGSASTGIDDIRFSVGGKANAVTIKETSGNLGVGDTTPHYPLTVNGGIGGLEKSADPAEPAEGEFVLWMSDGTGKGADGDILIASKAGGVTRYATLFDHSTGSAW